MLLRTFCELSCNPNFQHSLYLETLFRSKVRGEYCPINLSLPPYYNADFFSILKHYDDHCPLNIANMSIKDWYRVLVEDRVLMAPATDSVPATLLPVHIEACNPAYNWPLTWQRARMRGLPADLASHLFRHLHGVLATQDRVARLGGNRGNRAPGVCRLCLPDCTENLFHCYYGCSNNCAAAQALLTAAQRLCCPGLTAQASLFLQGDIAEHYELPFVFLLSVGFKYIWDSRKLGKAVNRKEIKAELMARNYILANSKYRHVSLLLENVISDFPT